MIDYKKGRVKQTDFGKTTTYSTRCGNYAVVKSDVTLRNGGTNYFACKVVGSYTRLISRHRTRNAAEQAVCKYDKRLAS